MRDELPLPPPELRRLVGDPPLEAWSNPSGDPLHSPPVPEEAHRRVVDFGCGCGRVARLLAQQRRPPEGYVGIDLHEGMIEWCREHLAPRLPRFRFEHQAVYNAQLHPDPRAPSVAGLPVEDGWCTLLEATSVFTHLVEPQAEHYLDEVARVLAPDGWLASTWFLFDRRAFPYLQSFQNALYVNEVDPTNAVAFDRRWLVDRLRERGLVVASANPPSIRGYHWTIYATPARPGIEEVELPEDDAPFGEAPPPARPMTREERLRALDAARDTAVELANAKEWIADLQRHLEAKDAELRRLTAT